MESMSEVGLLSLSLAGTSDAASDIRHFLAPIIDHLRRKKHPYFAELLRNNEGWANEFMAVGLKYWRTGMSTSVFLTCIKITAFVIRDALDKLADSAGKPFAAPVLMKAKELLELYGDALSVIWVRSSLVDPRHGGGGAHGGEHCPLSLEECRFASLFTVTSDGVLIMDGTGRTIGINSILAGYASEDTRGRYVWDVLGMDGVKSMEDFFALSPLGQRTEMPLFNGRFAFRVSVACLGQVSPLHALEYVACLSDITPLVRQSEILQLEVDKQTEALVHEKKQLEEMNITLRNVLNSVNEDREKKIEDVSQAIRRLIYPAIRKIGAEDGPEIRASYAKLLHEQLELLLSPAGGFGKIGITEEAHASTAFGKLTLTELKVCELVQSGHSSKKIAELLNISLETVKTHRRSIRRKLNIHGQSTQLGTFLLNQKI